MSCFLLDREDIDRIVYMFLPPGLGQRDTHRIGKQILTGFEYNETWHEPGTDEDRTALGRLLWRLNLVSCQVRYPNDKSGDRPGPIGLTDEEVLNYTWTPTRRHYAWQGCFEKLESLMYQSSEAVWDETGWGKEAYDLVERAQGYYAVEKLSDQLRAQTERMHRELQGKETA